MTPNTALTSAAAAEMKKLTSRAASTRGVVATRQMPSRPSVPARATSTASGISTISDR